MDLSSGGNLLIERPTENTVVARFTRPDLRAQLDGVGAEDSLLYLDFKNGVLDQLRPGCCVVLNFGLVLYFPTSFYQLLLQLRHQVHEHQGRLILCSLVPEVQESMHVMAAEKLFEIVHTEEQALRKATH